MNMRQVHLRCVLHSCPTDAQLSLILTEQRNEETARQLRWAGYMHIDMVLLVYLRKESSIHTNQAWWCMTNILIKHNVLITKSCYHYQSIAYNTKTKM